MQSYQLNIEQLRQYDLILDENDWDLYYWATQEPSITSMETAEGAGSDWATKEAGGSPRTKDEPTLPGSKAERRTGNGRKLSVRLSQHIDQCPLDGRTQRF